MIDLYLKRAVTLDLRILEIDIIPNFDSFITPVCELVCNPYQQIDATIMRMLPVVESHGRSSWGLVGRKSGA